MKIGKILYILAVIVLLAVFCVSAFYVGSYILDSNAQREEYDELAGIVESIQNANRNPATENTQPSSGGSTEPAELTEPTEPSILPEYLPLYESNTDMVGWIKIDGTVVNYPVMQTPDRENFYLERNFSKAYSSHGCIYARETCDVNAPSDNVTLYGHHMRDGSMFAVLDDYKNQSFYEEHDTIIFDTLTEHHTYKIFAVFKTSATVGRGFAYHQFENAGTEAEFNAFVDQCKALSFYDTGITPVYGDKLICLSTCEYTLENGRFVVVAYRIS